MYGEVDGKCIIKRKDDNGVFRQYASMTMRNGRATLDCELIDGTLRRRPALPIDSYKADLDVQLLHRRLPHFGNEAMRKLPSTQMGRGIDKVKIRDLSPCDFCKLDKTSQQPHPISNNRGAVGAGRCRPGGSKSPPNSG